MVEMKKVVVKLDLHDDKEKMKALKAVSSLTGIESIAMDMKDKKLTVIGDIDPVDVVGKLRKSWHTSILTVGPAKEPEKKDGDAKKDEKEKGKEKEKEGEKKIDEKEVIAQLVKAYEAYNPYLTHPYYAISHSVEENPNACVIS